MKNQISLLSYYGYFSFPFALIACGVFFIDAVNPQSDPGPGFLGFAIFFLFLPFYFLVTYTLYLFSFLILVHFTNKILKWKLEYGLYFITSIFIIILQSIWWTKFYTEISLPRRIIGWNIITIIFPWLPVIGAVWLGKRTS